MKHSWQYMKLNEVCDKGSSNVVINKLSENNGDYPLFGASGLVKNVDFYHQDKEYIGLVKDGAGVGRVNTYPAYSSLVGTMQYIFPKEECLLNYIKYFLVKLDLSHCVSGATIPHIYFKDYGKELIPVPSLEEQETIVSELDKINELIRLKKEQLNDYEKLAQSLFYEMFGNPIENEKSWEVKKFGEIASFKNGLNFGKNENGYSYKILGVGDFKDNFVVNSSSLEYINLNDELSSDYFLKPEDIIFVRSNGSKELVGRCVSVDCTEPTTYSGFCIRCRLNENSGVLPMYLLYVCKNKGIREYLTQSGRGCNISNVNQKILNSTDIIIPPLFNQELFIQRIKLIEQQKTEIRSTIVNLETLLASRMQYWFD